MIISHQPQEIAYVSSGLGWRSQLRRGAGRVWDAHRGQTVDITGRVGTGGGWSLPPNMQQEETAFYSPILDTDHAPVVEYHHHIWEKEIYLENTFIVVASLFGILGRK
ncbi:unnamed protein product [Caretta caretta]